MAIYGGLGAAGVPWLTGWSSGLGATGGYLIGFILAALFLGHFTDTYIRSRSFLSMLALMLFANFVLVYVPGAPLAWVMAQLDERRTSSLYHSSLDGGYSLPSR